MLDHHQPPDERAPAGGPRASNGRDALAELATPRVIPRADVPPGEPSRAPLRRRRGVLVYRDAARAYGVGVVLALLPLVYLFREWPPWAIRDALHGLPAVERAGVLATAHAIYGLATAPVARQLLASERLRWWWALPLPAAWWQGLHLRHLVLLDAPWLLAIGYGVIPLAAREGVLGAVTGGLAFVALTLAGQIAQVSVADRRGAWSAGGLLAWAVAVAVAVLLPGPLALLVGALALGPAAWRLRRPFPEGRARARGLAGGPPVLALVRLCWLAARRRDGVALGWCVLTQLAAVALVGLGAVHVGTSEPAAAAALRRGAAVICATVGTVLVLRSVRVLHGDRPLLDTWGIEPRHERSARLLLAGAGVLPAALAGSLVLPWLHPVGRAWPLDLALAVAWAAPATVRLTFALEAERRLHDPRLPRHLLWLGAALVLVGAAGTVLALLPWAALAAVRLPATQPRADAARRRFETAVRDDHRS